MRRMFELPFFRYLVGPDPRDPEGLPYSVPASEAPEFEPGTLVLEIDYQAEKMGRQQWQFEESLYAFGETLLFRPTLPHALFDQRSDKANVRPKDRRDKAGGRHGSGPEAEPRGGEPLAKTVLRAAPRGTQGQAALGAPAPFPPGGGRRGEGGGVRAPR
jgi:hypothetical protein